MNTSNSFPVSPLPCSILDAVSQSANVSVCREGKKEGEGKERKGTEGRKDGKKRERGGG